MAGLVFISKVFVINKENSYKIDAKEGFAMKVEIRWIFKALNEVMLNYELYFFSNFSYPELELTIELMSRAFNKLSEELGATDSYATQDRI